MPSSSRICASTKWPIRHFAITGIVTASMIERISVGSDIRATPPSFLMSAGTRSRAITAQAPESCAILACSAVTTSMITPPLSICARPALTLKEPFTALLCPLREPLVSAIEMNSTRGSPCPRQGERVVGAGHQQARLGRLEPFQHQRSLRGVLVVGQQAVPVQAGEHVHLLEHVQQRGHGASREVGLGRRARLLPPSVELADEEQSLDRREGDPELADRAVCLLSVQVQDHPVAVPLQRAVQVAPQDLPIEEPDRHLSGRRLRREVRIAGQLNPFHGGQRDPGGLVVVQAAGVVDLDQEIGLVEVEVARYALQSLVVKKPNDYLGHVTYYSTNPHFAGVLRTRRRPTFLAHLTQTAKCIRTASACVRLSLPARYGAKSGTALSWLSAPSPSTDMNSSLNRRRAR